MKVATPLFFASANALETSSTARNLLAAVGHRNVSHMEALIQGLADESVQVPGWKFDDDIRAALDAIRKAFVGNIQSTLRDQHTHDQEHLNCETETCFMGCINNYKKGNGGCNDLDKECALAESDHRYCRFKVVHPAYVAMAQSCAKLHCFIRNWKDEECMSESCLCPDLMVCHKSGGGYVDECIPQLGECKGELGGWLQVMIQKFKTGYATWSDYWSTCKKDYHFFLAVDMDCDSKQKKFEACKCSQRQCDHRACTVEFETCQQGCYDSYEILVKEKECLEKDRKIDWSATKKIQCYVDIMLHDYDKAELLSRCGSETCVNVVREEDYKHCHTICLEVDHEGVWPEVHSNSLACGDGDYGYGAGLQYASQTAWISGHDNRTYHDDYHLGDGAYRCDANGFEVFTRHRGGDKDRVGERRCTEHLDIDYPIPPCCECAPEREPVCDEKFHQKHYCQFDDSTGARALVCDEKNHPVHSGIMILDCEFDETKTGGINDCCPEDCGKDCFGPVYLKSVMPDGGSWRLKGDHDCTLEFNSLDIFEHTNAWAYNRCPCVECVPTAVGYPTGVQCKAMMGAHIILGAGGAYGL